MKHQIRVITLSAKSNPPTIRLQTRIRNNRNEAIYETLLLEGDGIYRLLNGLPKEIKSENGKVVASEQDRVATVLLNMSIMKEHGKKYWYRDFVFYDNETELPLGFNKQDNDANRTICAFLKKHQEMSVKDKKGVEQNKNIDNMFATYEFIDSTEQTETKLQENLGIIDAGLKLREWYKENELNPIKLINFAYIWGIEKISETSPADLFNKLLNLANSNMEKFKATLVYIDNDIMINVRKATQIIINKDFIIKEVGGQYVFNNIPIGKNIQEMLMFFRTNEQQYALLKNELGVKDNVPKIELPPTPVPLVIDPLASPPPANKQDIARKEKDVESLKLWFTDKIRRVLEKGQDIVAEKDGTRFRFLADTGGTPEKCLIALSEDLRIRDNSIMQTWLQAEIQAIKDELSKQ
jgi:hypothetical protein